MLRAREPAREVEDRRRRLPAVRCSAARRRCRRSSCSTSSGGTRPRRRPAGAAPTRRCRGRRTRDSVGSRRRRRGPGPSVPTPRRCGRSRGSCRRTHGSWRSRPFGRGRRTRPASPSACRDSCSGSTVCAAPHGPAGRTIARAAARETAPRYAARPHRPSRSSPRRSHEPCRRSSPAPPTSRLRDGSTPRYPPGACPPTTRRRRPCR